jgi:hypothetical protein
MKIGVEKLSILDLLHELARDGKAGLFNFEPIDVDEIIKELEHRSGENYQTDVEKWAGWFKENDDQFSDEDAWSIKTIMRIVNAERKFEARTGRDLS